MSEPLTFESFRAYVRDAASQLRGVILTREDVATLDRVLAETDLTLTVEADGSISRIAGGALEAPIDTGPTITAEPSDVDWRELFLQVGQKWTALLEHYDLAEDATAEDIIRVAERRGGWDALARQGLRPPRPPKPPRDRQWDGS